jgi:hypothetical protein
LYEEADRRARFFCFDCRVQEAMAHLVRLNAPGAEDLSKTMLEIDAASPMAPLFRDEKSPR